MSLPELTAGLAPAAWADGVSLDAAPPRVEVVTDERELHSLRSEWTELLAASEENSFFLTWEWLRTWWKHLGGSRRLAIRTMREGDRLVGLAPLCALRSSQPWRSGPLQFLGTGTVGSDYLDVVTRNGHREEAIAALADSIAAEGRVLELTQVPRSRSAGEILRERLADRGWGALERTTNVCPVVDLTDHSWDSYLATLSSSHRQNVRRRCRKLHDAFTVELRVAENETDLSAAFETLWSLHRRRWRDRGGSDALGGPSVMAFHRELAGLALERGWLRLYVLRLDGRPAAALYGFRYRDRFLYYQSGFDPELRDWSVGLVTMGMVLQRAIEEGVREFDLLHGAERYKFHWAGDVRRIGRLELYPPTLHSRLEKRIRRLSRLVKDGLRDRFGERPAWTSHVERSE